MDNYWNDFWKNHARSATTDHPQSQVLRTLDKKPIAENQFQELLEYVETKMEISGTDELLELCCGNGLFAIFFASKCKKVVGVDFAKELVSKIDTKRHPNISVFVQDVRKVDFEEGSFNKVLMYAGLQYLSYKETVRLFEHAIKWLKNGGLFFIGDIPDRERMWNFFNTEDREGVCFAAVKNERPVVGTWFEGAWLSKLGRYAGFKDIEIFQQPHDFPYAHYRFDMCLKKS